MNKYKAMIGLEMHCEISETKTKVFSGASNSYSDIPNCNISAIDMAFPGILPVVNKEAVRMALMASMVLKCSQPEYMYFERKNFYEMHNDHIALGGSASSRIGCLAITSSPCISIWYWSGVISTASSADLGQ